MRLIGMNIRNSLLGLVRLYAKLKQNFIATTNNNEFLGVYYPCRAKRKRERMECFASGQDAITETRRPRP